VPAVKREAEEDWSYIKFMREDMRTRKGLTVFVIAVVVVALIMSVVYSFIHP